MTSFNTTLLLLIASFSLICALPIQKEEELGYEHCSFKWGDVTLLTFRCKQDALLETKGLYMNLVRTFETPEGPVLIPIDRPNNHGDIYASTPADSGASLSHPDGTIYN